MKPSLAKLSLTGQALRGCIRVYQVGISPLLGPRCRFHPSCSEYACEAITEHGAITGVGLAVRRLLRCHPWGGSGFDPVPPHTPAAPPAVLPER